MLAACTAEKPTVEQTRIPTPVDTVTVAVDHVLGGSSSLDVWGALASIDFFPDGRAVGADRLNHRVLVFDDAGGVVDSIGQAGDGPGDLTNVVGVRASEGGELVTLSHDGSRVTVFGGAGAETYSTGTGFSTNPWQGVLAAGPTVLLSEYDRGTGHRLWRIPTDGGPQASIERPNHVPHLVTYREGGVENQITSPFSRETYWAVGEQGDFAYLSTDSASILVGTFDHGITQRLRIPEEWSAVPQDPAAFEWRMSIIRGGLDIPFQETPLPKVTSLYIDDSRRLWIGRTPRYSSMFGRDYTAVVLDLRTMGSIAVVLPPYTHLGWGEFFVRGDRAAGRRHDSLYRDEAIVLDLSGLNAIGPS